jgi:hypothetical protein
MKKILLCLLIIGCEISAFGQYFQRTFNRNYIMPLLRDEQLNSGIVTRLNFTGGSSNNFFHVGIGTSQLNSALPAPDNRANWLRFIRTNRTSLTVLNNLGIEMRDSAGRAFHTTGNSIAEVFNMNAMGGYVVAGSVSSNTGTGSTVPGGSDALFVRLTSAGAVNVAYQIDLGDSRDVAWCVRRSAYQQGTFLICGESTRFPAGQPSYTDCFVARVTTGGTLLWCKSFNFDPTLGATPSANNIAYQLTEDSASGTICVVGVMNDFGSANGNDGLIFELDANGNYVTSLTLHESVDDQFTSIRFTSDLNYIVGGISSRDSASTPQYNMWLVKFSTLLNILFHHQLQVQDSLGIIYDSKCYDLIERLNMEGIPEYYLFGPVYLDTAITQLVYRADVGGFGMSFYTYNEMKYDLGFGLDQVADARPKPGLALFSSVLNTGGVYSDSHAMKTYFNGAVCTEYCPANLPTTLTIDETIGQKAPIVDSTCTSKKIKSKSFGYQTVLVCNQINIGCGSNAREFIATPGDEPISIYPNPAGGILNIEVALEDAEVKSAEVIDMMRRIVKKVMINAEVTHLQLEIGDLPAGIYVLRITASGERQYLVSFVKE